MKYNQTTVNSAVDKPYVRTDFVFISISPKAFDIIHRILISCNLRWCGKLRDVIANENLRADWDVSVVSRPGRFWNSTSLLSRKGRGERGGNATGAWSWWVPSICCQVAEHTPYLRMPHGASDTSIAVLVSYMSWVSIN